MKNKVKDSKNPALKLMRHMLTPKGAPREEFPVTVKAPIITDATTQEGVQPLLDFVASIEANSNVAIAEKEAERLQPYFSALSVYLTQALREVHQKEKHVTEQDLEQARIREADAISANQRAYEVVRKEILTEERVRLGKNQTLAAEKMLRAMEARQKIEQQLKLQEIPKLEKPLSPGELSGLFNAMASFTRNTLISDVVIMPANIKKKGPAAGLFEKEPFNKDFSTGDYDFNFGFLQIFEGGDRKKIPTWFSSKKDDREESQCSTTIPTFTIDTQMMEAVAPHRPEMLLHSLQTVLTALNHDMVHHFQSPALHSTLAHKFINYGDIDENGPVFLWVTSNLGKFGSHLEHWSQLNHGKVFMAEGNQELVEGINIAIDHFFNELERIGKALPKAEAYKVIDYFGTAMAQTLTRTFPLNHDVMTHCLDRLQETLPLSEKELTEKTLINVVDMISPGGETSLEELREAMKYPTELPNIIEGYRKQGFNILPDDDNAVSYKGLKLLQLIKMSTGDLSAHVPEPVTPAIKELRADTDRVSLELIGAVAKTTGYRPK